MALAICCTVSGLDSGLEWKQLRGVASPVSHDTVTRHSLQSLYTTQANMLLSVASI